MSAALRVGLGVDAPFEQREDRALRVGRDGDPPRRDRRRAHEDAPAELADLRGGSEMTVPPSSRVLAATASGFSTVTYDSQAEGACSSRLGYSAATVRPPRRAIEYGGESGTGMSSNSQPKSPP